MELARVIGNVVATTVYQGLEGVKFLLVEALDEDGNVHGEPFVAADHDQKAGPGDIVAWICGREAALAMPVVFVPVDASIIGVVDDVHARPLQEVLE